MGLDAFGVEGLITITHFKNTSQLSVGSGLDFSSNEMSLAGIEASQHGCPVVPIGWARVASPCSQLAMAKNVNKRRSPRNNDPALPFG